MAVSDDFTTPAFSKYAIICLIKHIIKWYGGEEVKLQALLISALYGVSGQLQAPAPLPSWCPPVGGL
jgi:hypothetical protein